MQNVMHKPNKYNKTAIRLSNILIWHRLVSALFKEGETGMKTCCTSAYSRAGD